MTRTSADDFGDEEKTPVMERETMAEIMATLSESELLALSSERPTRPIRPMVSQRDP